MKCKYKAVVSDWLSNTVFWTKVATLLIVATVPILSIRFDGDRLGCEYITSVLYITDTAWSNRVEQKKILSLNRFYILSFGDLALTDSV